MKRFSCAAIALTLAAASCGGSRAANCTEYAAEVRQQAAQAESAEELMDWLQDSSEHAAKLMQASPPQGQACADAILEAMLSAAVEDFASLLGE